MGCSTFLLITITSLSSIQTLKVLIDAFNSKCPDKNQNPVVQVINAKFLPGDHATYLSNTITISKDMVNDLKIEIYPTKCKSKDAPDTCETYRSYKMNKVCRFVFSDKTPWSPLATKYRPHIPCPIKKGNYILDNGTIEASKLPNWSKSYWKVISLVLDYKTNELVFCNYMEFQIV